jgi:hypothetical protein
MLEKLIGLNNFSKLFESSLRCRSFKEPSANDQWRSAMRTLATAVAMATVLTVPAAAKTLLKNPQRLLADHVSASDVKNMRSTGAHSQASPDTATGLAPARILTVT